MTPPSPRENHSPQPMLPSNTPSRRSDQEEAATADLRDLRRKKRIKYLLYFVAFVIFQTGIIALFTLTIMKVRTPKFRVRSAAVENLVVGTQSNPSFDMKMNARLDIKNTNFGKFRYQNTVMNLYYRGNPVGEAFIPKASVGWRSTSKFNVTVNVSSANLTANSQLGTDLSSSNGVIPLTSQSELRGKVRLTFIFKKKKSTKMNCTMDVIVATKQFANIACM